ncbi:unnamed protein product [Haemonchus placei]|uniref:Uncharacterized protein n=1 Tax=Haemonchus placei TaxID=6290 RepID=A0A3P7VRU5_HAEPC|nr:unnamed protein product [Haemonchus placei]
MSVDNYHVCYSTLLRLYVSSTIRTITVSVIGVSGREAVKGTKGVGKSLICNRFVRGDFDEFFPEHCSVLSQTDFGGSPVINNDHWLYWGDRQISLDDSSSTVTIRVIEQTEFLDDETYEPIAGPSTSEPYAKRCCQIRLESRDKLMYIQKEQLGLEAEFDQQVLPDGKCTVDAFIYVFDASRTVGRTFERLEIRQRFCWVPQYSFCLLLSIFLGKREESWGAGLVSERCLERQPDYCNFVRIYGEATAKKVYDAHVNEAREHWMAFRLRALLPNLPRVFATLLDKSDVAEMSWTTANHLIHSHPLFDEFFQPLGQLVSNTALCSVKQALETEQRKERLEEEFEFLLSDTPQVTPGKPLQDVSIFLQAS